MSNCKYCGRPAGLLSKAHKECKEKNASGLEEFRNASVRYFEGRISSSDLASIRKRLVIDNYLSDEDLASVADQSIRNYTSIIHRPFTPSNLRAVDEYISAVGVAYANVNQQGAVDSFTQKLLKGFMVEFFTDKLTLPAAQSRCQRVISTLPISQYAQNEAYYYVLNKAAQNFLADGFINDMEQSKIDEYVSTLSLSLNNLPAQFQNSEIEKLGQASVLRALQNGSLPPKTFQAPIMLTKGEAILWAFNGATAYEEKIQREWVGRNRGMSFRVCRGVYCRTGDSKGHAVEHSSMQPIGHGTLYVTNKNLIFHSMQKGLKIPYRKIIGVTPYSDGIEIQRDMANAKRLTIQGFDPWFLMNVMSIIAE